MATCPVCQGTFENAEFCPRDGVRLESGSLLGGRYRLIRKVGEGAMGVVYEAEHVSLRRRVALKFLQRTLVASPEMIERLRREAQVTSGLGHPNIVECLDFGADHGQVYLVMEWLDGESLEQRIARERVDIATVLEIGAQACAGLAEAHERGVIHRDLKPANLFLTRDRAGAVRVKILDFGIAKLAAEQKQLTSTGVLVGTPNYMAPEQALGDPVDVRADVYALGVIFYELVAGRVPFQGDTPLAVLHQHTAKMPALPSAVAADHEVPPGIDTLIMTCLAKAPNDRYQTMHALRAAIEAVQRGTDAPAPPQPRAAFRPVPQQIGMAGPEDVDEVTASRPRRRRVLATVVASVTMLVVGFSAVVFLIGRSGGEQPARANDAFVPASVVDGALLETASSPAADAVVAIAVVPVDAALDHARAVRVRLPRFATETRVAPDPVVQGQPATFVITLSELDDAGREALASGQLRLRVTIEHFARHDVVAREELAVDPEGRATLEWQPRRGKHHVSIEPLANERSLGRARFDVHSR